MYSQWRNHFNTCKMLLSLQSTGPQYNHLQTNIQIPWNCQYIEYHVASINTRDILITSNDDVIEFEYAGGRHTCECDDSYDIDKEYLASILHYGDHGCFDTELTLTGRMKFKPLVDGFKFTKISHRLGLVTGLYNVKLNEEYPRDEFVVCERPIIDYANKLYLVSKQGQAIQSNIGDVEYTPSVIASIDHLIGKDIPIMQNFETYGKPIKNIVNIDSFKQIELELVDFQFQPVRLESPMFITIKVKPCENPKMKLK